MQSIFGIKIPIFIYIIFIFFAILFLLHIILPIIKKTLNNILPVLSVTAKVVSKRKKIITVDNDEAIYGTKYFITFNTENNPKLELKANFKQYNSILAGDFGRLTFRGKRILSFVSE